MNDNILASIGSPRAPILVQLSEYEGRRTIDIRRYFTSAADPDLKPTKKGVGLNKEALRILVNVLVTNADRIEHWLDAAPTGTSSSDPTLALRREALEELRLGARPTQVSQGDWRSPAFFKASFDGHRDQITMNAKHPVTQVLNNRTIKGDPEAVAIVDLLYAILATYTRSKELFDGVESMRTDAVFQDLEFNWGLMLERHIAEGNAP